MIPQLQAVQFLASVRNEEEARLALSGGANIIDCKEPAAGALGALPPSIVRAVRAALPASVPVSATIGDRACDGAQWSKAADQMASAGADYIKIGLFAHGDARAAIASMAQSNLRGRLVAVMLADCGPDLTLLEPLRDAGFSGVLLDTADKASGALPDIVSEAFLQTFLAAARTNGLFAGLAGGLRLEHVVRMKALQPDIIGFRGALCGGSQRKGALDVIAVRAVARAMGKPSGAAQLEPLSEAPLAL